MSRIKYITFILVKFLIYSELSAQEITISGYVSDSISNEKLIGATIWLPNYKTGTASNAFGYFSIRIKNANMPVKLMVSYTGYKAQTLTIHKDTLLNILLARGNTLKEVKVIANTERIEKRNEISTISISKKDLEIMPAIMGERDIIKSYQFMPGVQFGSEASSSLLVRGGSSDQNLVLLDDVILYNINHLGGFVGAFNSDAIKSSKLIKGGFPAQYGSRLSSVFDVRMKDGNNLKHKQSFTLGLISSKLLLEGPIKIGRSSYMFSARRFMYDLLMMPITKIETGDTWFAYTFYDLNLKLNFELNNNNHLYFSAYTGDDVLKSNTKNKVENIKGKFKNIWGNSILALRWNHLFNNNIFSNTTISYTRYRYKLDNKSINTNETNKGKSISQQYTGLQDISLKQDYEYYPYDFFNLKFGFSLTNRENRPAEFRYYEESNNQIVLDTNFYNQRIYSVEAGAYIETRFNFNNGLSGNIGLRFTDYYLSTNNFYSFEPRVLVNYLIADRFKINTSYARMQQYLHLLTGSVGGMRVDFWLPATAKVLPSQSDQITLGFSTTLFKDVEFSIESYYKKMDNLILLKEGLSYNAINNNWEDKIETDGRGTIYGTELLLQKKTGKHTGWLSYTYSKNMRQFNNINNGEVFPYRYDRRHNFNIVYKWQISKKVDFSATWTFATGEALTFPHTKFKSPDIISDTLLFNYDWTVAQSGSKNSMRGLAYHRLDIGINFRKQKKKGIRTWNISIYNVYNRANPYFYTFGTETNMHNGVYTKAKVNVNGKSVFPIMPSVSYSFNFGSK